MSLLGHLPIFGNLALFVAEIELTAVPVRVCIGRVNKALKC